MTEQPEKFQLKWKAIACVMIMVCASVLMTAYAYGAGSGGNSIPVVIESGSGVETASYIIYKDGDYTCAKNGTTGRIDIRSENASSVFQTALDNGKSVYVSNGEYEIDYTVYLNNDTNLFSNQGARLVSSVDGIHILSTPTYDLDKTSAGVGNYSYILSATAYAGATSLSIADTSGILVNDYFMLLSNKTWQSRDSPKGYDGEIVKVKSVAASSITLWGGISDTYLTTDFGCLHAIPMTRNVTVSGIKLTGASASGSGTGFWVGFSDGVKVSECDFDSNGQAGLEIRASVDVSINRISSINQLNSGAGYGISVESGSQYVTIVESYFTNCNHGQTNGQSVYGIPRDILFEGCVFNNANERQHSTGQRITYYGCYFNGMLTIETVDCTVRDSSFTGGSNAIRLGRSTDGVSYADNALIVGNSMINKGVGWSIGVHQGRNIIISDNQIYNDGPVPSGTSGGIVVWTLFSRFNVSNCTIENNIIRAAGYGIFVDGRTSAQNVSNIVLKDNIIKCDVPNPSTLGNSIMVDGTYSGDFGKIIGGNYDQRVSLKAVSNWDVDGAVVKTTGTIGLDIRGSSNIRVGNCYLASAVTSSVATLYSENSNHIQISDSTIISTGDRGIRFVTSLNNITVINCKVTANAYGIAYADITSGNFAGNTITASTKYYASGTNLRVLINGVGTNGENDPAIAGEWKGFGYEGVFVKWNAGATHYLSVYRGGAWYDMVLA